MLNENLNVSRAAFKVGYESPSQFGREYSRFFGVAPKRDIAALRTRLLRREVPRLGVELPRFQAMRLHQRVRLRPKQSLVPRERLSTCIDRLNLPP